MFNFLKAATPSSSLRRLDVTTALKKLRSFPGVAAGSEACPDSRLEETEYFGSNPGQLRMLSYMPAPKIRRQSALVVVLHGCSQTAAGYDLGAGWSTLANRHGFALLLPEQRRSNNPNGCFNWFQPEDAQRGQGEAASIRQMVDTMVRDHDIDPRRVFITGLSAGGGMTSVMLACYPETFAAGAIIAGLPYGAASTVQQAFQSMFQCPPRSAKDWGDMVRSAAPRRDGSWPRISVWHGNADKTVVPSNAREIIKQWTDVHGLPDTPSKVDTVRRYHRQTWLNDKGEDIVESYTITNMAHGTPLATNDAEFGCGTVGPFFHEVGISSSYQIANFFGITLSGAQQKEFGGISGTKHAAVEPRSAHLNGSEATATQDSRQKLGGVRIDIGAVISAALRRAGLITRG